MSLWPLSVCDKEQFDKLRSAYAHRKVESEIPLEVESESGWLMTYYRAASPATEQDLTVLPVSLKSFKFLSYQAQSMHTVLYDFMQSVFIQSGKPGLHLPAVVVALEFRRWVDKLGILETADENSRLDIYQRIQLIDDIQMSLDSNMSEHLRLLQGLGLVRSTLQSIQQKWSFFQAQESIQESLKDSCQDIAQVLRSVLVYIFYVMRGDDVNLSFDPTTYLSTRQDSAFHIAQDSLSGRVMQHLLLDPYVSLVLRQDEGNVHPLMDSFPRLDRDDGRMALESAVGSIMRFTEGALEAADSGLVTRDDCGVDDYRGACELLLRLHTHAAALARCVKLMKSAHKMASLGGDQLLALLAQQASCRSLVDNVFCFTRKELDATARECETLHNVLLQGHLSMKTRSSWFSNYGFERWSKFFSFATKHREIILSYAQNACKSIDKLSERMGQLSTVEIQKQLDAEAQYFQTCAVATLTEFGEEVPKGVPMRPRPLLTAPCEQRPFTLTNSAWEPHERTAPKAGNSRNHINAGLVQMKLEELGENDIFLSSPRDREACPRERMLMLQRNFAQVVLKRTDAQTHGEGVGS